MSKDQKPYKVIGAYDSETTNYKEHGQNIAFPILHQLGILREGVNVEDVTPVDVEDVTDITLYRHATELYSALDAILETPRDHIPVIMCHNLSFDMYGLSPWLSRHDVDVLGKSERKPITFKIRNKAGEVGLVIWDTLIFSQQSLERMGNDCGYSKASGSWDYDKIRTPKTKLTAEEVEYSKRDIYALIAWLGWFLRRNPDIAPDRLAFAVITKTGIVRERRRVRFSDLKGRGMRRKVGDFWLLQCNNELPKSDDELYTMMSATRGGFTFCATKAASIPYDLTGTDEVIAGYDATSQHPAQLVSHLYPVKFKEHSAEVLQASFELVSMYSVSDVLENWAQPFPVAFYGCFEFENLRPKAGTIWERYGVLPLASARYKNDEQLRFDEENGDKSNMAAHMQEREYKDSASNAVCAFGKVISCDVGRFYITELTAWEICQCYDFDRVRAIHGYSTGRFNRPTDMDILSVMQFYKAKNAFKEAKEEYKERKTISNCDELKNLGIAPSIADSMEAGTCPDNDVTSTYMGLKADLNSIFGISCSNQFRRDMRLGNAGLEYHGDFGICNAPKVPKVWYQFGQRIVGWSRIAQIVAMDLTKDHYSMIVNGDTDSFKIKCKESDLSKIAQKLDVLGRAIDEGKERVCRRVKNAFPAYFDPLAEIGHYVHEFDVKRFCASWNKAYCMQTFDKRENAQRFDFTLAGIPTKRRTTNTQSFIGVNGFADRLYSLGMTFDEICNIFLGYNVTYANDVIRLNGRKFPEWADIVNIRIRDYKGDTTLVTEPAALALFPMAKTVNDTATKDNRNNMIYALENNPGVNTRHLIVHDGGIMELDIEEVLKNA